MPEYIVLSPEEKKELFGLCRKIQHNVEEKLEPTDYLHLKRYIDRAILEGKIQRNKFGLNPILLDMHTA